jgi:hypothetical protein
MPEEGMTAPFILAHIEVLGKDKALDGDAFRAGDDRGSKPPMPTFYRGMDNESATKTRSVNQSHEVEPGLVPKEKM